MTAYERGKWDMFELITSAEYGKQYYFLQNDGSVWSRRSCQCMTVDEAYNEFFDTIEEGWANL